jgi:nicotinamide mononucleotide (NMN) deamidase PncC
MDAAIRHLIEGLHRTPSRYVLAVTGGGAGAAGLLLHVPGGSRTVLEVLVPYDSAALHDFLGMSPEHYCSAPTARAMAVRAWVRAAWLAPRQPGLGVACTASLASDRPKKGEHRCHIAVHDGRRSATYSLTLTKDARDREGEEAVVDALILNALAEGVGLVERLPVPLLPGEAIETSTVSAHPADLESHEGNAICILPDGQARADVPKPALLLPGSFNPAHAGHWALGEVAARLIGKPAAFEMSITNVDKPQLTVEELSHRLAQFAWRAPVWLTPTPTFAEKAVLFPGVTFAVGYDTAARIVEPRYYRDDAVRMAEALEAIRANGCRFLVAGRIDAAGRFQSCADLAIPAAYRDLFTSIAERDFRYDISSTELRLRTESSGPR